jgi:hypothetical protein
MKTRIVYEKDPNLVVYINWQDKASQVFFSYDRQDGEKPECQNTPYQSADMPFDEQEAADMIDDYCNSLDGNL